MSIKTFFVCGVVAAVLAAGCGCGSSGGAGAGGAAAQDTIWQCSCASAAETFTFSTMICSAEDPGVTAQSDCTKAGGPNDVCSACACGDSQQDCKPSS